MLVWMKSSGPWMERSTWLSAAKLTMARGGGASSADQRVADVALDEVVALVPSQAGEVLQVAGVGELVEVDDRLVCCLSQSRRNSRR
jgi:hypothetical protein